AIILEQIFVRIRFLITKKYQFESDISLLKNFFSNKESLELYYKIDDFFIAYQFLNLSFFQCATIR
ncbi:MAG: hypothetical protein Q8869_03425, partial [Candidatus Phytoplasma australasiaticum]|nr:hypothetical protein [Candidatus Phytoplasma australasiaticum]